MTMRGADDGLAAVHALLDRAGVPRAGADADGAVTFTLLERVEMLADRAHVPAPASAPLRERLGRLVRDAWVSWARRQPAPKASWLVPWADLSEPDREVDRQIGEAVQSDTEAHIAASLTQQARALLATGDPDKSAEAKWRTIIAGEIAAGALREPREEKSP